MKTMGSSDLFERSGNTLSFGGRRSFPVFAGGVAANHARPSLAIMIEYNRLRCITHRHNIVEPLGVGLTDPKLHGLASIALSNENCSIGVDGQYANIQNVHNAEAENFLPT